MSLIDAVFGYAPAQVLHVAARLGIADHLATGLKTSDSLAQATQTHEPSLRRLLRALAGLGVLAEFAPGEFELTDDGRVLRGDVPDSIRSTVLHAVSGEAWRTWGELEHTGADLPDELATAPRGGLLDYAFGYRAAQVIYLAARLGLADQLAYGAHTCAGPPSLLRALASLDVVTEVEPGRFALTETGRVLRSDVPDSIRQRVLFNVSEEVWRSWGALEYSVRTGESAWNHVVGSRPWEFFGRNPDKGATFDASMAIATRCTVAAIVAGYDFGRFGTVMDVGGGNGALIAAILEAYPGVEGMLYDLPGPAASARTIFGDSCTVAEGSFFDAVPAGADAYVLKSIVHDWDDEDSVRILRNCRRAGGSVLVVEQVLPSIVDSSDDVGSLMDDIHMLVLTEGRERTREEFRALFAAAGLELTGLAGPFGGYWVIAGEPSAE